METFKAFLDYFTLDEWKIISAVVAVILWVAGKLTDRYYRRKRQKIRADFERRLRAEGKTPPPDIPFPPE
ncbi:hypothetical protein ACCY16_02120 [Candidatus Pantoea formicae]|uniref:hypothetical protein n=1 Tax=Candidatus Pantoea formicae TaxID=2608355 RepID=UPI003EDB18A3